MPSLGKVFVLENGIVAATSGNADVTGRGSSFEVSGDDLELVANGITGFGVLVPDVTGADYLVSGSNDFYPSNEGLEETLLEFDGNGDIMPKS